MADFNNVVLVGRLTQDPELRYTPGGAPVCTFTLATNKRYTKEDGTKAEDVLFMDVEVWKRLAELCAQFMKKGREALVMGELKMERWKDAKTQQSRSKIVVRATQVQFLGSKPEEDAPTPDEEPSETGEGG
jgi:single-strand DNA-binding protein